MVDNVGLKQSVWTNSENLDDDSKIAPESELHLCLPSTPPKNFILTPFSAHSYSKLSLLKQDIQIIIQNAQRLHEAPAQR